MSKLNELRRYIREIILREMNATVGIAGPDGGIGYGYSTKYAFGKQSTNYTSGLKPMQKSKKRKKQKLFEDVINKVGFDLKFSDQAQDLMDYIHSNEKFEDDLADINELLSKMQQDGVFTQEDAFKVYSEFVERAAREYLRDMGEDLPMDEYFLKKDMLDVIYYHLGKLETPQSGLPNDNIDMADQQSLQQQPPPTADGSAPPSAEPTTGGGGGGLSNLGAPAPGEEQGAAPEGEQPPTEQPAGEEGEGTEEETPPKPEEIQELNMMIKKLYEEINQGSTNEPKKEKGKTGPKAMDPELLAKNRKKRLKLGAKTPEGWEDVAKLSQNAEFIDLMENIRYTATQAANYMMQQQNRTAVRDIMKIVRFADQIIDEYA